MCQGLAAIISCKNAILILLSPLPTLSLEPQSCVVVEDPLDVVRDLDEDTGIVSPTDRAEDDDPAQVVMTLSLTGQGRTSVQTKEASGLVSLALVILGAEDVGEIGGGGGGGGGELCL